MIINLICFFITLIFILLALSLHWITQTWQHLTMEELIYHLNAPLEGTNMNLISDFICTVLIPSVLLTSLLALAVLLINKFRKRNIFRRFFLTSVLVSIISFILICIDTWSKLDIGTYLTLQSEESDFIALNYTDPSTVNLDFPAKKRNLIYIFLESMETTYADTAVGGGFDKNCIPELTTLALEGEDFSGTETLLNGGHPLPGATWTIAGMFAQSSGLPLQIAIEQNAMDTQSSFFPNLTCLGDILEKEGYTQMLMVGSNATFGGRELYYKDHGNHIIRDYTYAIDNDIIPKNYKVGDWGYEDAKLFSYAKEELINLANNDSPFSLTLLTVDTHFEDGTVCQFCESEFGNNQYANVMACSSKQVYEFVNWIKEQSFYNDTTIIISGDHLTMDSNFCSDIPEGYARKTFFTVLNSSVEAQTNANREYSTFDLFPTTLAAMGVTIEGETLGLGVNLFSTKETLIEYYGFDLLNRELRKSSDFLVVEGNLDKQNEELLQRTGYLPQSYLAVSSTDDANILNIEVTHIVTMPEEIQRVYAIVSCNDLQQVIDLPATDEITYQAQVDISSFSEGIGKIETYVVGESGTTYLMDEMYGVFSLMTINNIYAYLEKLNSLSDKPYTIFIATASEPTCALNDNIVAGFQQLGATLDLRGNSGCNYLAILSDYDYYEYSSLDIIDYDGMLSDQTTSFDLFSSSFRNGDFCSIEINDVEYAVNGRGHNIVIFDNENKIVLDSVCFDTYDTLEVSRRIMQ